MAKEFKEFDKMFSKAEIEAERKFWLGNGYKALQVPNIKSWEHKLDYWMNTEIREAVYFADDHLQWQLFRVSLKGLSTQEKLYALYIRFGAYVDRNEKNMRNREKCRIDNYIGALVRGGQLSVGTYEVLK